MKLYQDNYSLGYPTTSKELNEEPYEVKISCTVMRRRQLHFLTLKQLCGFLAEFFYLWKQNPSVK